MAKIPFGAWLPDMPPLDNPGSVAINNVVPRTAYTGRAGTAVTTYGPMYSIVPYSTALNARCQGGIAVEDAVGNFYYFVGTASKLYSLATGTTAFTDLSKAGGYTTSIDENWSFIDFGNRVIATNYTDPPQTFLIGTDTLFSDLSTAAPKARCAAVVRDFLVLGNLYDGTGPQPRRVRWSALGDPTNFPTIGSNTAIQLQSDQQDLYIGDYGAVQSIVAGLSYADALIICERGLVRMQYVAGKSIFSFDPVEGGRGTTVPGSVIQVGGTVYYLAEDGFYSFDGANSAPIGAQQVDRTFFAEFDQSQSWRVCSAADPVSKIIYFGFPGQQNNAGNPNRLYAYNWAIQRWAPSSLEFENMGRSVSLGWTLQQLDVFVTLDAVPYSLDSRNWVGGQDLLSFFDAQHRLAFANGPTLAASIETTEMEPGQDRRCFVSNSRPIDDAPAGTVSIGVRERIQDALAYDTAIAIDDVGDAPQRITGRYIRARRDIPAGTAFTHLQAIEVTARAEGKR